MNSQNGFLLSYIKYGENDAVLHCFTEEDGFQSYFLKGIYTKKNKKKALLLPLGHLSFSLLPVKGNGIQTISKFELVKSNDIYTDIRCSTVVFFISDFLNQNLRHENKNHNIFFSINEFIDELENRNYQSHYIFFIKILKIQGVAPLLNPGNFLDPETGTFTAQNDAPVVRRSYFCSMENDSFQHRPLSHQNPVGLQKRFFRQPSGVLSLSYYGFPDTALAGSNPADI